MRIFEEILPENGDLTEGPAWTGKSLLITDGKSDRILEIDPKSKKSSVWFHGTQGVNGLNFNSKGELFGCEQRGRRIVQYLENNEKKTIAERLDGRKINHPNDLAIDPSGNIWFSDQISTIDELPQLDHASILKATPQQDGSYNCERMTFDTTSPNGLLFSEDYKTLYVAQSTFNGFERRQLRAYPVLENGKLGEYKLLHDFGPHRGIDGMTRDSEGNIIATCGWEISGPGGMICVFSPKGRIIESHSVPCKRPSNCTFGGENLDILYVTTLEGHLFMVKNTGRQGYLLYPEK